MVLNDSIVVAMMNRLDLLLFYKLLNDNHL